MDERSKRLTDRKLEPLCLVAKCHRVAGKRIQRNAVRKTEQTQWGEPLHRDPGRSLQVTITEVIIDRRNVVRAEEVDLVARIERVPQIIKPAHPGGALPLVRSGEQ